jgi:uncharacterized short protein YbdD (DUF466 family)
MITRLSHVLGWIWWWWRQVSGDAAYENYLQRNSRTLPHGSEPACPAFLHQPEVPMSAKEFYLARLDRRYRTINRCC